MQRIVYNDVKYVVNTDVKIVVKIKTYNIGRIIKRININIVFYMVYQCPMKLSGKARKEEAEWASYESELHLTNNIINTKC